MLGTRVYYYPKVTHPTMVAALPDMGNVAGLCMSTLVSKLDAKLFAEIYAYWPPYVSYKDGLAYYKQSTYRFYHSNELLIFTGDFNPSDPRRLYEVCYEVVNIAQRLNVKRLYSLGAALRASVGADPSIFYAVNNRRLLEEVKGYGINTLEGEGNITGFNGLILGLCNERGIDAVCILGEIDNPEIIQPRAAKSILKILIRILGLKEFSMHELDEEERRKRFMEEQMRYMSSMMDKDRERQNIYH